MVWIYIATTIFGGSFLIPMLFGGLASDVDTDFGGDAGDLELDTGDLEFEAGDVGADIELVDIETGDIASGEIVAVDAADAGADAGGLFDGAFGAIFASLVSFRTIVFFSTFFGSAGLVFGALGYGTTATAASAVLIGVLAALINSTLFGLLKLSQPNSQISDQTLEGRMAKVVLPMTLTQRGRIRVDLSGQPQYMVASPLDDGSTQQFDVGSSVVVVKVENGTALVSSAAELDD